MGAFLAQMIKYLPAIWETQVWQPTPVFLPGEFHGQMGLASYSSWGHKEPDAAE